MFYWIYDVPNVWLVVLFSIVFVGFSWAGTLLVRPRLLVFIRGHEGVNDLVGSMLSCYGVFYGLLLGLVAVASYQNYTDTDSTVGHEAAELAALYRDISSYPRPEREELQGRLREYTRAVIEDEWPDQRKGIINAAGGKRLGGFMDRLASFEPKTKGQEILHAEALDAFNRLATLRRLRVFSVTTGIPPIMWYVVVMGAVLNIMLIWLFDMRRLAHLFMGGLLSLFIGSVICLIAAMDNPYRGEVSIGPDVFREVQEDLMGGKEGTATPPPAR